MKNIKSFSVLLFALTLLLLPLGEGNVFAASTLKSIWMDAPDSVRVGWNENIDIEAQYSDNTYRDISTLASVMASSDDGKARFTKVGNYLTMIGTKVGWVTVDVSYTEGSITKTTYKNIKVKPDLGYNFPGSLRVGNTFQTYVRVYYEENKPQDVTNTAIYTSSNPSVATVSSTGLITALNPGVTTITYSYKEKVFGETISFSEKLTVK